MKPSHELQYHTIQTPQFTETVICPKSHNKLVKQEGLEARCLALTLLCLSTLLSLQSKHPWVCENQHSVCPTYFLHPSQIFVFKQGLQMILV